MPSTIRTYGELLACVREALRKEHPEWVGPRGESALCDSYEARLAGLLDLFTSRTQKTQLVNCHE